MSNTTIEDTTYNGWTNYVTWRVQLELVSDYINSLLEDGVEEVSAEQLEEYVDGMLMSATTLNENEQNIALDYARAFVSNVNWRELVESANETLAENKEG